MQQRTSLVLRDNSTWPGREQCNFAAATIGLFQSTALRAGGIARNMRFSANLVKQSFLILGFPVTPPRDHYAIRYLVQAMPSRLACPLSLRVVVILAKQGTMTGINVTLELHLHRSSSNPGPCNGIYRITTGGGFDHYDLR